MHKSLFFLVALSSLLLVGCGGGGEDTIEFYDNTAPIAVAGDNVILLVGETATFNGKGLDADRSQTLTYQWTIVSKPEGSKAEIDDATSATINVIPDQRGTYELEFTVYDGISYSATKTAYIYATFPELTISLIDAVATKWPDCEQYSTVEVAVGETVLGEVECLKDFTLADLTKNGESLSENEIFNMSWWLQIIDIDQSFGTSWYSAALISSKTFNFDVDPSIFIQENDIETMVGNNLDAYQSLDIVVPDWDEMSTAERVASIIGDVEQVKLNRQAALKNYPFVSTEATSDIESGFPHIDSDAFELSSCRDDDSNHYVLVADIDTNPGLDIAFNHSRCGSGMSVVDYSGELIFQRTDSFTHYLSWFPKQADTTTPYLVSQAMIIDDKGNEMITLSDANPARFKLAPVIADFDSDGADDIVLPSYDGDYNISVLDRFGNAVSVMECADMYCSDQISAPVVVDLDQDGDQEAVATISDTSELYVFEHDGSIRAGFPVQAYQRDRLGNPVVADVDNDGEYEIMVASNYFVQVFDIEGNQESMIYPQKYVGFSTNGFRFIVADANGDGIPNIIIQSESYLLAYQYTDGDYQFLPGWPQKLMFGSSESSYTQPLVADINGNGQQEILAISVSTIFGSYEGGYLLAYEPDGTMAEGFPKDLGTFATGDSQFITPAVADIDLDGRNEIVVAGLDGDNQVVVYVYDMGGEEHDEPLWGQFNVNPQHNAVVPITTP